MAARGVCPPASLTPSQRQSPPDFARTRQHHQGLREQFSFCLSQNAEGRSRQGERVCVRLSSHSLSLPLPHSLPNKLHSVRVKRSCPAASSKRGKVSAFGSPPHLGTPLTPSQRHTVSRLGRSPRPRRPDNPCLTRCASADADTSTDTSTAADISTDPSTAVAAGVALYNPKSFDTLVKDAARAVETALDSGHTRLEVQFPSLPSSVSGYEGASDDYIDANVQLALYLAQQLRKSRGTSCKLVLPDQVETRRAARKFKTTLEMTEGVSLGSLEDAGGGKGFFAQLRGLLDLDFDSEAKKEAERWCSPSAAPDLILVTNASATELLGLEAYVEEVAQGTPVVLFNMELDTLRADLGLFGFPPRDVHYRFLSLFLPVFYIRPRDYSKSVPVAPFILNYSGAVFRQFPGPWQVMIKQANNSYACVAEAAERFTLGEAKEELLTALGLQEIEGSTLQALRRGYKNKTWWEEGTGPESSTNWRT